MTHATGITMEQTAEGATVCSVLRLQVILVESEGRDSDRRAAQLMLDAGMRRLPTTLPLGHFSEVARNDVWLSPTLPAAHGRPAPDDGALLDMRIPPFRPECRNATA